jgi:hypothetical protein
MRHFDPIPIPEEATPFQVALGPGPWIWEWAGWRVRGDGDRVLGVEGAEGPILEGLSWPRLGAAGFTALPGRLDSTPPAADSATRLTLLFLPGGQQGAIIARGEGAALLGGQDPAVGSGRVEALPMSEPGTRVLLLGSIHEAAGDRPMAASARALPMKAHRPLLASLEAVENGLSFRAPGVDAARALFWAPGTHGSAHSHRSREGALGGLPLEGERPIQGRGEALESILSTIRTFEAEPGSTGALRRLPDAILLGFMGASGDASVGRLRLAPTLPRDLGWFECGGIRLGDGTVHARYRADGAGHTLTVEQREGSVPINLVLDLGLYDAPEGVWLDGAPAEVETTSAGPVTRFRFQMPLDRPRRLRIGPSETASGGQPSEEI